MCCTGWEARRSAFTTTGMDMQHLPMTTVWCGGVNSSQDVCIRLVPHEMDHDEINFLSREPVAVVKVHSHRLEKCSEYFKKCLTVRWSEHSTSTKPSKEFNLEMIQGLEVQVYADCFSRMYTPFRKDFTNVKCGLALLQVASQIEFTDLVQSVSRYLSMAPWFVEDELRIWQGSCALDSCRSQAKDLVARLEMDGPIKVECRKKLRDLVEQCMGVALSQDRPRCALSLENARCLITDLLSGINNGQCEESESAFAEDVVGIVGTQAKEVLAEFHEYCRQHSVFRMLSAAAQSTDVARIVGFGEKLDAVCWALEAVMKAHVAEDVVEFFLELEFYPAILAAAVRSEHKDSHWQALEFLKLMLLIYSEVAAAKLLLGMQHRVALVNNWNLNNKTWNLNDNIPGGGGGSECNVLRKLGFAKAIQEVFLGLPLEHQMELLERHKFAYHRFTYMGTHVSMLTTKWPAS